MDGESRVILAATLSGDDCACFKTFGILPKTFELMRGHLLRIGKPDVYGDILARLRTWAEESDFANLPLSVTVTETIDGFVVELARRNNPKTELDNRVCERESSRHGRLTSNDGQTPKQ